VHTGNGNGFEADHAPGRSGEVQHIALDPSRTREELGWEAQTTFKVQRAMLGSVREYLEKKGYLEVRTPKLISTATEGGASLFSVLYYNRPSFLAQSPQLYKEELVLPFEKVYEIGPAFRAEESRTQRHLSEITSIDIEEAFVDYHDVMDTLEGLLRHVLASVKESCGPELEKAGRHLPTIPEKLDRMKYGDVVKHLAANHVQSIVGLRILQQHPLSIELCPNLFHCHFSLHCIKKVSDGTLAGKLR